jgi:GNAT superfamily N-acetyltransferase
VNGIAIRNATAADSAAIQRLIGQLGYSATQGEVQSRLSAIEAAGQEVLVATFALEVIACLSTSTMIVPHRPAPVGRISMMVVDERWRGKGVGAEMAAAAERLLAGKGCQIVEVTSNLRRTDAHRFWERLGYERTSARFARNVAVQL